MMFWSLGPRPVALAVAMLLLPSVVQRCRAQQPTTAQKAPADGAAVPLVAAAGDADVARVRSLLSSGANPNAIDNSGTKGWTPLMAAAKAGAVEVAEVLLKAHANVNATNEYGATALAIAIANHGVSAPIVKLLKAAGAKETAAPAVSTPGPRGKGGLQRSAAQKPSQGLGSGTGRIVRNSSGLELEVNTIFGSDHEEIGREFMTGKEAALGNNGQFVRGSGEIAMYTGKGFWHPVITAKHSNGKFIQIKVGVHLIEWDDNGKTTSVTDLEPTIECDNGQEVKITSNLAQPTVKDGVLLLETELGHLSLKITFGTSGTTVGSGDFLFVTDKDQLRGLRDKSRTARALSAATRTPEKFSQRWAAETHKKRLLAYLVERPKHFDLHVMYTDGSGSRRLSDGTQDARNPAWSPDGSRLLFVAYDGADASAIWCVNPDGTGLHRLMNANGSGGFPQWSPDGKRIAYSRRHDGADQIHVADADGKNDQQITTGAADNFARAWSPDGSLLALETLANRRFQVRIMAPDGTNARDISDAQGSNSCDGWSQDGKHVIFHSEQRDSRVYVANILTGNTTPLAGGQLANAMFLRIAPAGDNIGFIKGKNGVDDPWIMKMDGSGQRRIIEGSSPNGYYSFSPDGQFIAFSSKREGTYEICVVGIDGQDLHQLTKTPGVDKTEVLWQPGSAYPAPLRGPTK